MKLTKATLKVKEADSSYQEFPLLSAYSTDDGWDIETELGHLLCPKIKGFTPIRGMIGRFYYDKSLFCGIRGIDIEGITHKYMTTKQADKAHKKMVDGWDKESKQKFKANKVHYKQMYSNLHPVLQKRMDRLRKKNKIKEDNYNWEPYELFVLEQATKIHKTLKTTDNIAYFRNMEWEEQKKMVPELDEGHSNNTFLCACSLAYALAEGKTEL